MDDSRSMRELSGHVRPRRSAETGVGSDRVDVQNTSMSVHWPKNDHLVNSDILDRGGHSVDRLGSF